MATYRFTTPTIRENPGGEYHPLFSRIEIPVGISVLKKDGEYFEVRYPSSEEVAEADIFLSWWYYTYCNR